MYSVSNRLLYSHIAPNIFYVAGAGISVSAGIPDFRSKDGLFKILKEKHPKTLLSGKDLFDVSVFNVRFLSLIYAN
jgi:NAD-dependent SIR2 family protein deacetylase